MQFKLCKNVHCFDTRKITAPFFRDHLFCFNAFTDTTYTVWVYLDFFLKICKMPLQFSKVFRIKVFHKWMTLNYPYIRGDQIGLFKLVTLNCILNRITGVTFGC
jgi:hypothetical protein